MGHACTVSWGEGGGGVGLWGMHVLCPRHDGLCPMSNGDVHKSWRAYVQGKVFIVVQGEGYYKQYNTDPRGV